ncbi:MAG: alpha/beta hydrolase [Anaerolineae bacterium]|nr:alpha/beta hydrolase [Gemmatimonadaceae bacterium]
MHNFLKLAIALACSACSRTPDAPADREQASAPRIQQVKTGPGVSLEVVDWGGQGRALVFLAGLGNTAHVFDDFAPAFTDSFRVVGITRRGFGASASSPPASNVDTLVRDIVAVLDTLGLDSAVLVGHSIAGEEMTRFGETHATRCSGLVYLDAAYDRTELFKVFQANPIPQLPPMQAADSASRATVRAYMARQFAVELPESEVQAISRFDANGRYAGSVTPDSNVARVLAAVRKPSYESVKCPSLAVYAVADSTTQVLPYYAQLDSAQRRQADVLFKGFGPLSFSSRARVREFPQNRVVELLRANHYVFIHRRAEVDRAMRAFLSEQR